MSLIPLLFDDFYPARPSWHGNWLSASSPESDLHPLTDILHQLAHVGKDNSITIDKDKFQTNIDVQQFKPEEITVKLDEKDNLIVEGKHEEKPDEHGYIYRHFVRRYELPDDVDVQKVQSKLSSDGVLSLSVPKKPEAKQPESKDIPISLTGPVGGRAQKEAPKEVEKKK